MGIFLITLIKLHFKGNKVILQIFVTSLVFQILYLILLY